MTPDTIIGWTLITVTYNSSSKLRKHWREAIPHDVEWIVVDNASTDDSVEVAKSLGAQVISLTENTGFGRANNMGFELARGTFVAFVNPDLTVDYTTLVELSQAIEREPGIVLPQLLNEDGTPQPNGRGAPSLTNKLLSRMGFKRIRDRYYLIANHSDERYVSWGIGAGVAARRETFKSLGAAGPWDPRFFVYYEDADIALRAWRAGLTVRVIGSARWVHGWARETASGLRLRPWLLEIRGASTFYSRWPEFLIMSGGPKWRPLQLDVWGSTVASRRRTR